jgi:signal transduction histidine kinase
VEAPDSLRTEGTVPERRRILRVVQGINLVFLGVDLALNGPTAGVLGGRLLVSGALGAADVVLGRPLRPATQRLALCAAAVLLVAGFGLLALDTGGAASPYATFLAFLSIVIGIAIPDEPAVNLVAGVSTTAVGLAFSLAAHQPPAVLGFVLLGHGSCTFYGTVAAVLYRRMRRRERAAWTAQAEAAALLTRSELRRATAERAAAVGRIAAELGHELSSPVASAAANLRFVEEELPRAAAEGDLGAAVRESREALERVGRVIGDLRVLTPEEEWTAGEVDLVRAIEHGLQLAAVRLGGPAAVARHLPRKLPPVVASSRHLSQVVSILVGLLSEAEREAGAPAAPVALDVALEGGAVKVAFTGRAAARTNPASGPTRAGVGLALCRELAEPWGGRVEARPVPGGRLELALTLRAGAPGGLAPARP